MLKVKDIAEAIEEFAPKRLQEPYDNTGLQVGDPEMEVGAALLCLDVTEEVLDEALERRCNLIVSHHPLLFGGLKEITGRTQVQRIVAKAIKENVAVYAAHTNLDSAWEGVSHEMARELGMTDLRVLDPNPKEPGRGLGLTGNLDPVPALQLLRRIKERFKVKSLRHSGQPPRLVLRKAAVCGGSGASLIGRAVEEGADIFISGDLKYHDFTTWGDKILLADIGHYESESSVKKIFSRIIRSKYPDFTAYFAESESNPVKYM